jgi:transcriptional regulator with XRE-family HTH domain
MSDDRTRTHPDPRVEALQTWAAAADRHARTELLLELYRMRKEQRPRVTQAEVAARMGISQATVSAFESRRAVPRLATLQRYARAIGVRLQVTLDRTSPEAEFAEKLAVFDHDQAPAPARQENPPTEARQNGAESRSPRFSESESVAS